MKKEIEDIKQEIEDSEDEERFVRDDFMTAAAVGITDKKTGKKYTVEDMIISIANDMIKVKAALLQK